ncbi:hypothetical protein DPMN_062502 [Dreissena polymorpha]|uniref:Uncharacterized protein n=1 Tax=Dreissena polymorpha TaxID=45954 RepID=A0A9D4C8W6_DREPO|nr:hypothetical protein DPMN_062502 [Dreissena polymorpha]
MSQCSYFSGVTLQHITLIYESQSNEDLLAVEDKGEAEPDDDVPERLQEQLPVHGIHVEIHREEPIEDVVAQIQDQRVHAYETKIIFMSILRVECENIVSHTEMFRRYNCFAIKLRNSCSTYCIELYS